jgi:hypothetical protein
MSKVDQPSVIKLRVVVPIVVAPGEQVCYVSVQREAVGELGRRGRRHRRQERRQEDQLRGVRPGTDRDQTFVRPL